MGFDFGPDRDVFLGGPNGESFDGRAGTDVNEHVVALAAPQGVVTRPPVSASVPWSP